MLDTSKQYQNVVEDQMELVCRYMPDCTLTFVNQAYCRHHEKNREELIGKSFLPSVRPDDRQVVLGFSEYIPTRVIASEGQPPHETSLPENLNSTGIKASKAGERNLEPLNQFHHDNSFMISPSTPKIYEINAARTHMPQRS